MSQVPHGRRVSRFALTVEVIGAYADAGRLQAVELQVVADMYDLLWLYTWSWRHIFL